MRGNNFEGRAGKLKSEDGFGREREVFFTVAPFCGEKGLFGKKTAVEQGKSREKRTERQKIEQKKKENRRKSEKRKIEKNYKKENRKNWKNINWKEN